ncbi:MAG: tRNA (N6-threonylcarbamoyladenosine(37)-N6)-methyltransferase TrmO [Clostridia bacterium]|nr:tRNA (N6-threonylcarbamoyladenosine(37)-N6)-methyltransferase TrmO [Clostridia bacterium]
MKPIARIRNGYEDKFGIPRQPGLAAVRSVIVFEPEYRVREALRGIEGFSHLWLIWVFDRSQREDWSPTVRPPRLGGNARVGVFASRSPFRPNPIGLSCVRLEGLREGEGGLELVVTGADLMDGTPILDIKPYLPYADSHPEATGGFTDETPRQTLKVEIPADWRQGLTDEEAQALTDILSQDPRPAYQRDPERVYGFGFGGMQIRFSVAEGIARVTEIRRA